MGFARSGPRNRRDAPIGCDGRHVADASPVIVLGTTGEGVPLLHAVPFGDVVEQANRKRSRGD